MTWTLCLPTSSHSGQSDGKDKGLPVQEKHPDCSGVAQHALVLGCDSHVKPNPSVPTQPAQSADFTIQSESTQESVKLKSPYQAPAKARLL